VNVVNTGGNQETGRSVSRSVCVSVVLCVYTMTNNSNDITAPTVLAAMLAITFPSLPCSKVALLSPSPFLVFKSLHLAEICTLVSAF